MALIKCDRCEEEVIESWLIYAYQMDLCAECYDEVDHGY